MRLKGYDVIRIGRLNRHANRPRKQRKSLQSKEKQLAAIRVRRAVLISSRGDKTRLELFCRGVVELQTSQSVICSHVAAVLA